MKLFLICAAAVGLLLFPEKDATLKETAADPPEQPEPGQAIKKAARGKNGRFMKKETQQEKKEDE